VVNISTVSDIRRRGSRRERAAGAQRRPDPATRRRGDWYHKFFRGDGEGGADDDGQDAQGRNKSLGSGFVLWPDGYIPDQPATW